MQTLGFQRLLKICKNEIYLTSHSSNERKMKAQNEKNRLNVCTLKCLQKMLFDSYLFTGFSMAIHYIRFLFHS